MKNTKYFPNLSLKLLNHRIIRIKSNAFLKIVLHAQTTDDESVSIQAAQPTPSELLSKAIDKIAKSVDKEMRRYALEKVKFAGWKLIPEAHAQEQEDSLAASRSNEGKMSQSTPTILPLSTIILRDTTNLPHFHSISSIGQSPLLYSKVNLKQRSSREITMDTSRSNKQQLRIRKRALILKKLENVEMCIDYLTFQNQLHRRQLQSKRQGKQAWSSRLR